MLSKCKITGIFVKIPIFEIFSSPFFSLIKIRKSPKASRLFQMWLKSFFKIEPSVGKGVPLHQGLIGFNDCLKLIHCLQYALICLSYLLFVAMENQSPILSVYSIAQKVTFS